MLYSMFNLQNYDFYTPEAIVVGHTVLTEDDMYTHTTARDKHPLTCVS